MNDNDNCITSPIPVIDINNNTTHHITSEMNTFLIQNSLKDFDFVIIVKFCLNSTGRQFVMLNHVLNRFREKVCSKFDYYFYINPKLKLTFLIIKILVVILIY